MDANIKTPQDALEWIERCIHEKAEMDGELTNEHAIQLAFIQNMLAKFPRRNCDVGTAEEQDERFHRFCVMQRKGSCAGCPDPVGGRTVANGIRECALVWAQMPYTEGGAK